ncbi:hypothetical protein SAY87_012724 [Trapa incisa]|uniref:Telomerase Cajal body protein 1 n=1 Tax=Trapa incisa TaxID=236973 RepID=A0AAN7H1G2_9MYRT|nr:hypothetical protein SAY87_012724 [Trapa incisa]
MAEVEEEQASLNPDGVREGEETVVSPGASYTWPAIRFDVPPERACHFFSQFRAAANPNNFFKGLKWSPDGSCFLTSSEDKTLRVFTLPDHGSDVSSVCASDADEDSFVANPVVMEGEAVYDFCWYPCMSATDPISCVFATTTRDHPIHVWDSTTGQLRCTYRAYDAVDEITAAFSIAFNPAGTKIFAGYNKSVRVFDVHRPGRDFKQFSTVQGNKEGQTGIISAIAFCPAQTGLLAMGSYSQTTAICREDNMELLYVLHGQQGGVTHVMFSKDGNYLYTGGRKDPYILCWDIRRAADVVYKLYRSTEDTNQRILFDIEPFGRHLGTGGQDGLVHIYDLQSGQWISGFQAASDTVNAFSYHPYLPLAASSSGHRRFEVPDDVNGEPGLGWTENCASIWSFSFDPVTEDAAFVNDRSPSQA